MLSATYYDASRIRIISYLLISSNIWSEWKGKTACSYCTGKDGSQQSHFANELTSTSTGIFRMKTDRAPLSTTAFLTPSLFQSLGFTWFRSAIWPQVARESQRNHWSWRLMTYALSSDGDAASTERPQPVSLVGGVGGGLGTWDRGRGVLTCLRLWHHNNISIYFTERLWGFRELIYKALGTVPGTGQVFITCLLNEWLRWLMNLVLKDERKFAIGGKRHSPLISWSRKIVENWQVNSGQKEGTAM